MLHINHQNSQEKVTNVTLIDLSNVDKRVTIKLK